MDDLISKSKLIEDINKCCGMKEELKEAKAMGCTEVRRFEHIQLEKIEMIINALEKQVGKKVKRYGCNIIGEMTFNCPSCNLEYYVTDYEDFNYCPNCGQKIDWSEVDD